MAVAQLLRKPLRLSSTLSLGFRMMASSQGNSGTLHTYETLKVSQARDKVLHVELNRPEKRNAMNQAFWREMVECFNRIAQDSDCHAVVLSGAGKVFTSGLDLMDFASSFMQKDSDDIARIAWNLRKKILAYQETFSVLEKCTKPVIVAFHGACIGGGMRRRDFIFVPEECLFTTSCARPSTGVDLITAADIRFCTQDAWIQVKEVDIGLAADVGTLQRLPRVIGNQSLVNELVYTARKMMSEEAKSCGLVSRVFENKEAMLEGAFEVASEIASKSPVAVQGSKLNLVYARDHSVPESLNYMAAWNMSMLQTEDLMKSAMASIEKKTPRDVVYSKL